MTGNICIKMGTLKVALCLWLFINLCGSCVSVRLDPLPVNGDTAGSEAQAGYVVWQAKMKLPYFAGFQHIALQNPNKTQNIL